MDTPTTSSPVKRNGRPPLMVASDTFPGEELTVKQAAERAEVSPYTVHSGLKRGVPVGEKRIVFRRISPLWADGKTFVVVQPPSDIAKQIYEKIKRDEAELALRIMEIETELSELQTRIAYNRGILRDFDSTGARKNAGRVTGDGEAMMEEARV
jgi:hypothetical protein